MGVFHRSSLVDGSPIVTELDQARPYATRRNQSIQAYKVLFKLLYRQPSDLECETDVEALLALTDITAYAEYYLMLLPYIAKQIADHFLNISTIWKWIARYPEFFLVIGHKLESSPIFADAMRHAVLKMADLSSSPYRLYDMYIIDPSILPHLMYSQTKLLQTERALVAELRRLGSSWYQAHAESCKRKQGPVVRTTWYAADLKDKSTAEKCRFIAASIYREMLDHKLLGTAHWSHVEYMRNGRKGGDVPRGSVSQSLLISNQPTDRTFTYSSLRNLCQAILDAEKAPQTLDIFGKDIAERFAHMFIRHDDKTGSPAAMIAGQLKALVRNAAQCIRHHYPEREARDFEDVEWSGWAYTKHDDDSERYPYVEVPWYAMPGRKNEDDPATSTDEFELGVEVDIASPNWLQFVGVEGGPDNDEGPPKEPRSSDPVDNW